VSWAIIFGPDGRPLTAQASPLPDEQLLAHGAVVVPVVPAEPILEDRWPGPMEAAFTASAQVMGVTRVRLQELLCTPGRPVFAAAEQAARDWRLEQARRVYGWQ
jgi:hypothetical protein